MVGALRNAVSMIDGAPHTCLVMGSQPTNFLFIVYCLLFIYFVYSFFGFVTRPCLVAQLKERRFIAHRVVALNSDVAGFLNVRAGYKAKLCF